MTKHTMTLLIVLMFHFVGVAQEADSVLQLNIGDAAGYAIRHNRALQNASVEVRKAELQRWQTVSGLLPQVNAGFDYQNMCGYEMVFGGGGGMSMSIPLNPSGALGVNVSVALSGAQIVGIMLNDIATEMKKISAKKNEQDIVVGVKQVYLSILVMEQTVGLLEKSLENINKLYETTRHAVEVGVAEQTDADQLSVQVSSMQSTINVNKRTLEMLYNSLALQLGCDINSKIELTSTIDDILKIDDFTALMTADFDLNKNYSYQLLQKNVAIADKQVTMSAMRYLPSLSVFYKYSYKTYFNKDASMNMTPPNLVGLSLVVPIWSSGQRTTALKEAKLSREIAENNLQANTDALNVQYRQLLYNLTSAMDNYEIQKSNIDVSERVFQNITNKYEYGHASSLDITNASNNLITAQSNYISSILEIVKAANELEKLLNLK